MSAQLITNASHYVTTETEPAACLNHWPLPGWTLMTTPSRLRYVRLQQRAEHFETRHFDLAIHLRQLNAEQEKGMDHRAKIARLERLTDRAQQHASTALEALFTETDRLHGRREDA